jgi:excisionase family DNA binding protein
MKKRKRDAPPLLWEPSHEGEAPPPWWPLAQKPEGWESRDLAADGVRQPPAASRSGSGSGWPRSTADVDDVLTPAEVSRIVRVPAKTITQLCREERIPGATKVGRRWRIPAWAVAELFGRPREERRGGDLCAGEGTLEGPGLASGTQTRLGRRGIEGRGQGAGGAKEPGAGVRRAGRRPGRADVLRLLREV